MRASGILMHISSLPCPFKEVNKLESRLPECSDPVWGGQGGKIGRAHV